MVAAMSKTAHFDEILNEFGRERDRQIAKHGVQNHLPNGTGPDETLFRMRGVISMADLASLARFKTDQFSYSEGDKTITYLDVLIEEMFEAFAESDPAKLREELIQVGTVAAAWIEAIDSGEQKS